MTEKDTDYWRREAEKSDRHEWCEVCEKSYFASFDECPHKSHPDEDDLYRDDGKVEANIVNGKCQLISACEESILSDVWFNLEQKR